MGSPRILLRLELSFPVNDPRIESFLIKQVNKSRLLMGSLAGVLAVNVLVLGVVSWLSISRTSAMAQGNIEISQASPAPPVVDANVAAPKRTAVPTHADSQPAVQVDSSIPPEEVVVDPAPPASLPPSPPPTALADPPATALPREPLVVEIQEAINSLKPLLAQARKAFSEIPLTASPGPDSPSDLGQEIPAQPEKSSPPLFCLVNPSQSGGEVHYAVDGTIFSLRPGEYHELALGAERQIEFHRGEDFGYTKLALREGVYVFIVGAGGWDLEAGKGELGFALRRAN